MSASASAVNQQDRYGQHNCDEQNVGWIELHAFFCLMEDYKANPQATTLANSRLWY